VISALPSVLEVGVAGVPDAMKGEVRKAWVVLKPGTTATETKVRAYCRERLAPYKVPGAWSSEPSCPRRWSARSCAARWRPASARRRRGLRPEAYRGRA
jgi:acyl-coenzyme A synthetase/AMP-(fatty) acid ligase